MQEILVDKSGEGAYCTPDIDSGCTVRIVDCWLLTVDGRVKKMKIARIICCELDSTWRQTPEARIWYHSGLTAGIDMIFGCR